MQSLRILLGLALLGGLLLLHAAGCDCKMQADPPCSYGSCAGTDFGPPQPLPNGVIDLHFDSVTIGPGESVDLKGKVFCPPAARPCKYKWDFGNGQTSTEQNPGKVVFTQLGFYVVTFAVSDATGLVDPIPSRAYVTVWNGEFKDSFDRKDVDYNKYGWRQPLLYDEIPLYSIEAGWLRARGDWTLPGSTGIMAWPLVQDVHVDVVQRRSQQAEGDHYSDIILRMHPSAGVGQFYRVRIWQEGTPAAGLEIAMFKISDANDQHGILFSDPTQPPATTRPLPTQCKQCPYVAGYPRNKDIRIVVELKGRFFQARLEDPAKPGVPVLSAAAEDTTEPYLYDGLVGLTQFQGVTYFKNFVMRKIADVTHWDGAAAPADAGVQP